MSSGGKSNFHFVDSSASEGPGHTRKDARSHTARIIRKTQRERLNAAYAKTAVQDAPESAGEERANNVAGLAQDRDEVVERNDRSPTRATVPASNDASRTPLRPTLSPVFGASRTEVFNPQTMQAASRILHYCKSSLSPPLLILINLNPSRHAVYLPKVRPQAGRRRASAIRVISLVLGVPSHTSRLPCSSGGPLRHITRAAELV